MMNELFLKIDDNPFARLNFYTNGKLLESSPFCGMSVRSAGSMRFRWNEKNPLRDEFLSGMAKNAAALSNGQIVTGTPAPSIDSVVPVPVELIHSQIVYDAKKADDTAGLQGDGIITKNKTLMPVVTVADCMPLYLFDPVTSVFGIVHSGWKGTGIAAQAIKLAQKNYGSNPEDFCVIIGPHIRDCCYIVNQERADYFTTNFGSDCVTPLEEGGKCYCGGRGLAVNWDNGGGQLYRLSLEKANLNVLANAGVKEENITIYKDCTCCNEKLGSNRRETALAQSAGIKKQPAPFTVQAAFIRLM